MKKYYSFAGSVTEIVADDAIMYENDGVLSDYRVGEQNAEYSVSFSVVDKLSGPCGGIIFKDGEKVVFSNGDEEIIYFGCTSMGIDKATSRMQRCGKRKLVELGSIKGINAFSPRIVMNCLGIEHMVAENGGYILHSSYIIHNGEAILFTAPSGTGKSTQADIWVKTQSSELINGDRTAVIPKNGKVYAYGIPFSGSSGVGKNKVAPVKAIVYLAQAEQNKISRLVGSTAFRRLWEGCSINMWNKADVEASTDAIMNTLSCVNVFYLECVPDETAASVLLKMIENNGNI